MCTVFQAVDAVVSGRMSMVPLDMAELFQFAFLSVFVTIFDRCCPSQCILMALPSTKRVNDTEVLIAPCLALPRYVL